MMYPVKKMYMIEQEKLEEECYDVFSQDFFDKTLLDFLSELGHVYENQFNGSNRKEKMISYVKGFKAILGIGIALHCEEDISKPNIGDDSKRFAQSFFDIYEKAVALRYTMKDHAFYSLFSSYLMLGSALGFNFDDVTYVYENEK